MTENLDSENYKAIKLTQIEAWNRYKKNYIPRIEIIPKYTSSTED